MKKLLGILLFISIALSANAQLLWKVSGKGLEKPSYIFGTYHLSPLSIKDSIAAMPQAMSETAQVYGEVVMSEMATPAFMQSMQQQMMMPKDTTLQSLFTPEQYEEVGKAIKENMMVDIAMLAQLKPAAINQQLVVLLYMKHTPGFNPQEQLDTYFQQQAAQQGKKIQHPSPLIYHAEVDPLFDSYIPYTVFFCKDSLFLCIPNQFQKYIWKFDAKSFGNLALFRLEIWRIIILYYCGDIIYGIFFGIFSISDLIIRY